MSAIDQIQSSYHPASSAPSAPEAGYTAWYKIDAIVGLNNNDPISTLDDSSVNNLDLVANSGEEPLYITNNLNGKPIARFDGVDNRLFLSGGAISSYISASAGTMFAVFKAVAITTNNATPELNDCVWSDVLGYTGTHLKSVPEVVAYNYDTNADTIAVSIATGTWYIVKWRHSGGNLYISVNGGSETSVTSGNTGGLTGTFQIAMSQGIYSQIDFAEIVAYNTSITADTTRDYLNGKYAVY